MSKEALAKAIEILGGQVPLARKIRRTQQHVSWALRHERGKISGADAVKIERATKGAVLKSELRPDIFPPENKSDSSVVNATIRTNPAKRKAIQP